MRRPNNMVKLIISQKALKLLDVEVERYHLSYFFLFLLIFKLTFKWLIYHEIISYFHIKFFMKVFDADAASFYLVLSSLYGEVLFQGEERALLQPEEHFRYLFDADVEAFQKPPSTPYKIGVTFPVLS